jgi:DNA-binding NarL/FixJ family response regulator
MFLRTVVSPAPLAKSVNPRLPRALVVDDHPIMAAAVATAVSAMRIFQGVDTAGSLAEAVQLLEANPPCSLAILDLHLGDSGGQGSLNRMREQFPDIPVLVFTGDDSLEHITMAFECNARGYVTKNSPMSVLNSAIQIVLAGSSYIPPEAASILGFAPPAGSPPTKTPRPQLSLSGRQEQVFQLLLQGMPNKVIAARLSMAEGTAKAHLNTVFRVLGVRTRVEAILRAREMGLI